MARERDKPHLRFYIDELETTDLTYHELLVFKMICFKAWKSKDETWIGSQRELARSLPRLHRNTISEACESLIKMGKISVESRHGVGSVFTILKEQTPHLPFSEVVQNCTSQVVQKCTTKWPNSVPPSGTNLYHPVVQKCTTVVQNCTTNADIPISELIEVINNNNNREAVGVADVVVELAVRLKDRGFGKSKIDRLLADYTIEQLEHAEAFVNDLEFKGQVKNWGGLFLDTIKAGPDERPLPKGVFTHTQHKLKAEQSAKKSDDRHRAELAAAQLAEKVTAWVDSVGSEAITAAYMRLSRTKRAELGGPLGPNVQAFFFKHQNLIVDNCRAMATAERE